LASNRFETVYKFGNRYKKGTVNVCTCSNNNIVSSYTTCKTITLPEACLQVNMNGFTNI